MLCITVKPVRNTANILLMGLGLKGAFEEKVGIIQCLPFSKCFFNRALPIYAPIIPPNR